MAKYGRPKEPTRRELREAERTGKRASKQRAQLSAAVHASASYNSLSRRKHRSSTRPRPNRLGGRNRPINICSWPSPRPSSSRLGDTRDDAASGSESPNSVDRTTPILLLKACQAVLQSNVDQLVADRELLNALRSRSPIQSTLSPDMKRRTFLLHRRMLNTPRGSPTFPSDISQAGPDMLHSSTSSGLGLIALSPSSSKRLNQSPSTTSCKVLMTPETSSRIMRAPRACGSRIPVSGSVPAFMLYRSPHSVSVARSTELGPSDAIIPAGSSARLDMMTPLGFAPEQSPPLSPAAATNTAPLATSLLLLPTASPGSESPFTSGQSKAPGTSTDFLRFHQRDFVSGRIAAGHRSHMTEKRASSDRPALPLHHAVHATPLSGPQLLIPAANTETLAEIERSASPYLPSTRTDDSTVSINAEARKYPDARSHSARDTAAAGGFYLTKGNEYHGASSLSSAQAPCTIRSNSLRFKTISEVVPLSFYPQPYPGPQHVATEDRKMSPVGPPLSSCRTDRREEPMYAIPQPQSVETLAPGLHNVYTSNLGVFPDQSGHSSYHAKIVPNPLVATSPSAAPAVSAPTLGSIPRLPFNTETEATFRSFIAPRTPSFYGRHRVGTAPVQPRADLFLARYDPQAWKAYANVEAQRVHEDSELEWEDEDDAPESVHARRKRRVMRRMLGLVYQALSMFLVSPWRLMLGVFARQ
ncbi:uncharacterized protein LAESUDRAFT_726598 [Laetiporus sulphureus 93-53]|uniref:Uncharacterized protein n=1 Tax=Laetiporus sulphureus 93-53 TaxID=1314785 RepID=A0A165E0K9_9APHY|nr:uncharacterized protein LAESUDRAFT_726598 [Laetiporus sulphureus 93-53]KZT06015.1 hypothetical protein LAESUDRAFT_726598 [Laetiporus sulphureus 93-53]